MKDSEFVFGDPVWVLHPQYDYMLGAIVQQVRGKWTLVMIDHYSADINDHMIGSRLIEERTSRLWPRLSEDDLAQAWAERKSVLADKEKVKLTELATEILQETK